MNWKTGVGIVGVMSALLLVIVTMYQLADYVIWLGLFLLVSSSLLILYWQILSGFIITERYKGIKADTESKQADARQKQYLIHTDGYGMSHMVHVRTGHSQNLTLDARTYRNGHAEPSKPEEMETLRLILAARHASTSKAILEQPFLSALPTPPIELLPILHRARRVLIFGASEAGKTTLLQHIAADSQNVVIVDPHYEPGKWPDVRIIGAGRNFIEVISFLTWLESELDKRSKRKADGDSNFIPMTIIIDELSTIKMHCGNEAIKPLASMIMESNKFGFRLFIGGHSKLVELLGLKGMSDIREGLFIVHLRLNQATHERTTTVDLGDGEQPCQFPPFYGLPQLSSGVELPDFKQPDLIVKKRLTERQMKIMEMLMENKTDNEIAAAIFQKPRLVGAQFYEVKEVKEFLAANTT